MASATNWNVTPQSMKPCSSTIGGASARVPAQRVK